MINRHTLNEPLFQRNVRNPILRPSDWPYSVHTVFNPGAVRLADGTTLLLCRVEDRRGQSHLSVARSRNGIDDWLIDAQPSLLPDLERYPEELWGVEDPRITYVPEQNAYYVAYTSYSRSGPLVSLASTRDFITFDRLGAILPPQDKDAALLPRRIDGDWAMIHRPMEPHTSHIWISRSPDLLQWDRRQIMLEAREGGWWDANKIGIGGPLIETPEGWLMIYHGVRVTAAGAIYRLGLALFDLLHPQRCLLRGDEWVFAPEEEYERHGDVDNVVFPCGQTIADDGDTLLMYYGAADSCIALATTSIRTLLDWLHRHGELPITPLSS